MNMDLQNSDADSSQRMLNAIGPGSVVPIHRTTQRMFTIKVRLGAGTSVLVLDFKVIK